MITTRFLTLFALTLTFVVSSCNKTEIGETTQHDDAVPGNIKSFLAPLGEQIQTYIISNDSWQQIAGEKGTTLQFNANTFVTLSGGEVSGDIEIQLIEVFNKSEMILTNKATNGAGGLLVSGGEIFINATQNGTQLKFASGKSASVMIPTSENPDEMDLFVGSNVADDDELVWEETGETTATCRDSVGINNYCFNVDSCRWINCDKFLWADEYDLTNFTVRLSSKHSEENTNIWVSMDGAFGVGRLTSVDYNEFSSNQFLGFPITREATIVVISDLDGVLHGAFVPIVIADGHIENVTVVPMSVTEMQSSLLNLN